MKDYKLSWNVLTFVTVKPQHARGLYKNFVGRDVVCDIFCDACVCTIYEFVAISCHCETELSYPINTNESFKIFRINGTLSRFCHCKMEFFYPINKL